MDIDLLKQACNTILDMLPKSGLNNEERRALETKINSIVARAMDPKESANVEAKFHTDELAADVEFEKKGKALVDRILVTRVMRDVLTGTSEKTALRVTEMLQTTLPRTSTHVHFPFHPEEIDKEGQAKHYHPIEDRFLVSFKELFARSDDEDITDKMILTAFGDELKSRYRAKHGHELSTEARAALKFIGSVFEEAFDEICVKVEEETLMPYEAVEALIKLIQTKLQKNVHEETLSREEFGDLYEKKPGIFSKPSPLNTKDPLIRTLIEDYKNGTWKDGEEREVIIRAMSVKEEGRLIPVLNKMLADRNLASIVRDYLDTL